MKNLTVFLNYLFSKLAFKRCIVIFGLIFFSVSNGWALFADQVDAEPYAVKLFEKYKFEKYTEPSVAMVYLDSLLMISNELSSKRLAKVHAEMALQYTYLLNVDSAYRYCSLALRDTVRDSASAAAMMAASIMGNIFAERQMADSSYYYHHIAINGVPFNSADYASFLSNYAVSLTRFDAYAEAEQYYQEAYEGAILHENNPLIVQCITGLVLTGARQRGSYSQAHARMLKSALKYLDEPGEIFLLKQNIAAVLGDLGNLEEAEALLNSIQEEYPELYKNPNPYGDYTRALLKYRKGEYQLAISMLKELREEYPNFNRTDEVYLALSQAYAHLNIPDSTEFYSNLLFDLNDLQKSEANAQALKRTEENMDLYKMRLDLLNAKNIQHEKELQIKNLLLLILGLIIVCMVLVGWFYTANKRKKEAIEKKSELLAEKNKKLTLVGLEVAQKNQWLNSLKTAVNASSGNMEEINGILKTELMKLNKIEKDWTNFMSYFEDLYEGFYKKLRQVAPSIKTSELRMASLIRLELGNGEIADLLGISTDSVKSSKYRLKKRLNLSEKEDLSIFVRGL